jgi:plasmid replication initiation protein
MQHNAITSGRYDFTACQLDILFLLLASLEKGDAPDKEYTLQVKDIEAITGRLWNYDQLQDATGEMGSRVFTIDTKDNLDQLWLFQRIRYIKGEGRFIVKLSEDARPYLFDLKNNFTRMQLKSVLTCSSKYAKRLYALACQWRKVGSKKMTISNLKEMLYLKDPNGKEKEQYKDNNRFTSQVLEIAKKQINENTDIHFDYQMHKKGRSFEEVTIYVDHRKEKQLSIDFRESIDFQKNVKEIEAYGVSRESAKLIAQKNINEFHKLIEGMKKNFKNNPIDDPASYIVGAFQKKGVLPKKLV